MNSETKIWSTYFTAMILSIYVHEIGHCIPAWANGYWAIPTPAKEYISDAIPVDLRYYVSLGGIISSILISLVAIFLNINKTSRFNSAMLAGVIALPGMYMIRFILKGRGHDATEFQEAQSALGLSYSGHSLDWIFLILCILGIAVWIIKSKPKYKIIVRLSLGFVLTFVFMILFQGINNAIFDPIFQVK